MTTRAIVLGALLAAACGVDDGVPDGLAEGERERQTGSSPDSYLTLELSRQAPVTSVVEFECGSGMMCNSATLASAETVLLDWVPRQVVAADGTPWILEMYRQLRGSGTPGEALISCFPGFEVELDLARGLMSDQVDVCVQVFVGSDGKLGHGSLLGLPDAFAVPRSGPARLDATFRALVDQWPPEVDRLTVHAQAELQ
jgi:hypothetical protein